ncbi:MAG: 4-vinyl reductase [Gloeomargarita sp. GMQP_bins_120]
MLEQLIVDRSRKLVGLFGEPVIFHCHHYNLFLQQTIEDPAWIDGVTILRQSAQEIFFSLLQGAFGKLGVTQAAQRWQVARQLFSFLGFGQIDGDISPQGADIELRHSHYAQGWLGKYGATLQRHKPIDHVAVGYAAAALDAIYGSLGDYQAEETQCQAVTRGDHCVIRVQPVATRRPLTPSPGMGRIIDQPASIARAKTSVDYEALNETLWGLPLAGDEQGQIRAFNVLLTRMPANYYNRIQYRFLDALRAVNPALEEVGCELLRESGHVCVFYTFGNIMASVEWESLVQPLIQNDTDWIHGGYAVASSLGWGRWELVEIASDQSCRVVIDGNYETNYFLATYPQSATGACFFAQGAVPALMNLVYRGHIAQKPTLDETLYNNLFRRVNYFRGQEVRAREKGDPWCEFIATAN